MDPETVTKAVGDQLTALDALFKSAIGLALVAGWAGLQRTGNVEILSVKIPRRYAYFILSGVFFFFSLAAIIYFLRVGDALRLLTQDDFLKSLSAIATHEWILNPFSHFGTGILSNVHSSFGYGALIFVWWIANSSLNLLADSPKEKIVRVIAASFLISGICCMLAIQYVFGILIFRYAEIPVVFRESLTQSVPYRLFFCFFGIFLGVRVFIHAQRLQRDLARSRKGQVSKPME